MIEAGLPDVTVVTNYGMLAPASTPLQVVETLNTAVNQALRSSDIKVDMARIGFELVGGSAQDFAASLAGDLRKWAPIVKMTNFQIE
jgi:tripartite-type tricarboxylate transporter receptor subunit TctC